MAVNRTSKTARGTALTREWIVDPGYRLFSRYGVHAVRINRIIDESGVSTGTLYRDFPGKIDVVLAFLNAHRQRWTFDWLPAEIHERTVPAERPRALFDALDDWFHCNDFESEVFTRTLLEISDKTDAAHHVAAVQLGAIRASSTSPNRLDLKIRAPRATSCTRARTDITGPRTGC
jgi:AcrR family transcriptional regulator